MDAAISKFRNNFHGYVSVPCVDTNFDDAEDADKSGSTSFSNLNVDETLSPGSATASIFDMVPETPCGPSPTDSNQSEASIHESPKKINLSNSEVEQVNSPVEALIDRLKQFRSHAGSVLASGPFDHYDTNYAAIASLVQYLIKVLNKEYDQMKKEAGTGYFKRQLADLNTVIRSTPGLRKVTGFVPDFCAALKTVLADSKPLHTGGPVPTGPAAGSEPAISSGDEADDQLTAPRQLLPEHKETAIKDRLDQLSKTLADSLHDEMDAAVMHQLDEMRSKLNIGLDIGMLGELSLDLDDLLNTLQRYGAEPAEQELYPTDLDFIDPQLLRQFKNGLIHPEIMKTIREQIADLQKECAAAWEIQNVHTPGCSTTINLSRKATVQHLINALRAMRPVLQGLEGGQVCSQEVSALLLFLIQPTDKQDAAELRAVHQRVIELNELLLSIDPFLDATNASLQCLKSHFGYLLALSASLISGVPPDSTTGNAGLLEQLLKDIQPLFSGTDGSVAGENIINSLLVKLQEQRRLTCEDSLLIASKLDALFKSLDSMTNRCDGNDIPVGFIKANVKYLQAIFHDSISAIPNHQGHSSLKSDADLLVMLEALRIRLTEARPETAQSLAEIAQRLRRLSEAPALQQTTLNTNPKAADRTAEKINLKAETVHLAEKRERQTVRLQELAEISLALDEIAQQVPIEPPQIPNRNYKPPPESSPRVIPDTPEQIEQGKVRHLEFLKTNLSHLALVVQVRWAEEAQEAVVSELTDYYRKLWGMAYSEMAALGLTFGLSIDALIPAMPQILELVSAEVGITFNGGMMLDDENFPGRVKTAVTSATVRAGIGKIVEGALKGNKGRGKYEEWDTARKYVLANFSTLLKSHAGYQETRFPQLEQRLAIDHRPMVSGYLNRHAVLGKSTRATEWALFRRRDICRIDRIEAIQQKFDNNCQRISQAFSLLLGGMGTRMSGRTLSTVALDRFGLEDGGGLNLNLYTDSVGGSVDATLPVPVTNARISAAAEKSNSKVELIVPTALCKKMAELQADISACAANAQNPMMEAAIDGGAIVGGAIVEDFQGNHAEKTRLLNKISDEIVIKSQWMRNNLDWHQAAVTNRAMQVAQETHTLLTARALWETGTVYQAQVDELHNPDRYQWSHDYGTANDSDSIAAEFEDIRSKLRSLHRDFQEYTRFQSQKSRARASKTFVDTIDQSIEEFHKMYGANSSAEFLYRLLMLNGWLCVSLQKVSVVAHMHPAIATQIEKFRKENGFELFESAVLKPPFAIDRKELLDQFSIKKQAFLTIRDKKISIRANANFEVINPKISKYFTGGITVSGLSRRRSHTNPLRDGDSFDWEIRIGANIGITPDACQSLLAKLCAAHRISDVPNLKDGLADCLANQPHLASTGYERSFIFRSYKPSEELFPGLVSRRFYIRQNNVKSLSFAPKISAGMGMSVGVTMERSATSFVREKYQPDSIWYFLQRYFHDFGNNHISKTGAFHPEGYWLTIVQQQRSSLKEIFKKFAREAETLTAPVPADSLTAEFNALEEAFRRRRISLADLQTIATARAQFIQVARVFNNDPSAAKYQAALAGFQNLLYAYCPHIRKMKTNSALYRNMEFSLTDTVPVPLSRLMHIYRRIARIGEAISDL